MFNQITKAVSNRLEHLKLPRAAQKSNHCFENSGEQSLLIRLNYPESNSSHQGNFRIAYSVQLENLTRRKITQGDTRNSNDHYLICVRFEVKENK